MIASGTFEIVFEPHDADGAIGQMAFDKRFEGGFVGTSRGRMLTAGTPVEGSAAYVAIEVVEGTLDGLAGGFTCRQVGSMVRGETSLEISIVADSGTGELEVLTGTSTIEIIDGVHHYKLEYSLPDA